MTECAESAETLARSSSAEWSTDAGAEPSGPLEEARRLQQISPNGKWNQIWLEEESAGIGIESS